MPTARRFRYRGAMAWVPSRWVLRSIALVGVLALAGCGDGVLRYPQRWDVVVQGSDAPDPVIDVVIPDVIRDSGPQFRPDVTDARADAPADARTEAGADVQDVVTADARDSAVTDVPADVSAPDAPVDATDASVDVPAADSAGD